MILVLTATTGCSKMTPNSVSMGETKTESAYTYNADEDDDMKDLETINVYNDLDTFINENNQQAMQLAELDKDTETSSEELTQKKNAVITNYVVNLYNLAKARLQADVDSAYTHTDKYLSYLALMQTFVDAMTSESEEFDKKMAAGDSSIQEMDSFKAMTNVENFYMETYDYVKNGKLTSSDSKKSETSKLSTQFAKDIRGEKSKSNVTVEDNGDKKSSKKSNKKSSNSGYGNDSEDEDDSGFGED